MVDFLCCSGCVLDFRPMHATQVASRYLFIGRNKTRAATAVVMISGVLFGLALLSLPIKMPIGVSYSDIYMYLDATHRLELGQLPHRDFLLPVNSLPFLSFAQLQQGFPSAQPVLTAQMAYLLLLSPALLAVVLCSQRHTQALLCTVLFLAITFLPFNWGDPGFSRGGEVDGAGAYNRAAGLTLFVLVAAIWLNPPRTIAAAAIAYSLTVLWYTKMTAFLCGVVITAPMMFRRDLDVRSAAIIVFGAVFGPVLQLVEGTLGSYLTVLHGLIEHGGLKTLVHRIRSEVGNGWPLLACALGSGLFALCLDPTALVSAAADIARAPIASLRSIMNLKSAQFAVLVAGAVLVESQNTGSQNYAFLIPAVLAIVPEKRESAVLRAASGALAVAFLTIMLGPPANRLSSMLFSESTPFVADTIPGVGVSTMLRYLETAQSMLKPPVRARASISGGLPGELDSPAGEVVYLMSLQNGVDAFRAWQAASGVPVRSIASIDFVDLFPSTLLLQPVLGLPIVFDPERNIPLGLVSDLVERWRTADAIVVRRCIEIDMLVAMARPALEQRRLIALDPCWDLYVTPQP